jgi:hypothetical protein
MIGISAVGLGVRGLWSQRLQTHGASVIPGRYAGGQRAEHLGEP